MEYLTLTAVPIRPTYWNIPKWAEICQYIGGFLAVIIFLWGVSVHIRRWKLGQPEKFEWRLRERISALFQYALAQAKLAIDPYAWIMHLAIFWGMVFLALGTALATIDWDVTHLLFNFQFLKGSFYLAFEVVLDIFGLALIIGLLLALFRRYILKPERLKMTFFPTFPLDSLFLIIILLVIALTGFLIEATRLAVQKPQWQWWSPVGSTLAMILPVNSESSLRSAHLIFWITHAISSFIFIAAIPYTKAFHLVSSAVNIFLRNLNPPGELKVTSSSGVRLISDFTWRQLLQFSSCTWCGRCQEKCPASQSGYSLSPRNLILKLFTYLKNNGTTDHSRTTEDFVSGLHGTVVEPSELWACTTCRACEEVCPVFIEHPRSIIDLRRCLVAEGAVEKSIANALNNLNRYGNSFGKSDRMRAKWTQNLDFKIKDARKEEVEYLWFVGDYASYDPRMEPVTKAVATLFHKAELNFGILYEAEKNSGNDARRLGEEGLFDLLREKNIQAFEKARFKYIVTTDPHSFNTLKNEYKLNGTKILHYTELISDLITLGKIKPKQKLNITATYHDPCYLGRYNNIYEPPRKILNSIGINLIEMPRNRNNSYCCGAGGGKIWMEETPNIKERPAENRVKEAAQLGVSLLVVACPKDLAMFRDAVKTTGLDQKLEVRDLGELVLETIN